MPWLTILKYGLPVLLIAGILGGTYHAGWKAANVECQTKLARMQDLLSSLAAKQEIQNRESEQRMAQVERERQELTDKLTLHTDDYAGLAARLRVAESRTCPVSVPGPGSGESTGAPVTGGYCTAERFDTAVQRVITACRADSIALEVLKSKPLCECAK
jgi:hypothetical protein